MDFLSRKIVPAIATALAITASCGRANAQYYWDVERDWNYWSSMTCRISAYQVVPMDCGDTAMFLQKRWPITIPGVDTQKCCDPLSFTTSKGFTIGGEGTFKVCGIEQKIRGDITGSVSQTDGSSQHVPCGCVQLVWEQDYQVYKRRIVTDWCYYSGTTRTRTEHSDVTVTVIKKVPNGGRTKPYIFSPEQPCQGCTTENRPAQPALPPAPAWDPNLPKGFPTVHPNNLPQPDAVPWRPEDHGAPDFESASLTSGADKQATLDYTGTWADRKITSQLDLNLWEMREIVYALNELRAAPYYLHDGSTVTFTVADGVSLNGTLGGIVKQLKGYAAGMVNSKSYGDFNQDGERNSADIADLQDHIFNDPIYPLSEQRRYDLDGDGLVTQSDMDKFLLLTGL